MFLSRFRKKRPLRRVLALPGLKRAQTAGPEWPDGCQRPTTLFQLRFDSRFATVGRMACEIADPGLLRFRTARWHSGWRRRTHLASSTRATPAVSAAARSS